MKIQTDIANNIKTVVPNIVRRMPGNMFKAVMKCGGLVKKEAGSRAPSKKIAKALKVIGKNKDGSPESNTGINSKAKGWYGKFFESGTKPHEISAKDGKVLSWLTTAGGKAEFTGKKTAVKYYIAKDGQHTLDASEAGRTYITVVHNPGMKEKPFLMPAFQVKKTEIKEVIGNAIITTSMEGAKEGGG